MELTESTSGLDLVVCACGGQQYTARDAIDAAIFRGELDVKWKEFLHQVAAERRADELDVEPDESAISGAAEAFRYEYDLITAEETEAWLANRSLTFDDFSDYFTRQYFATAIREKVAPDEVEYQCASPDLRRSFLTELILSGDLDRMTSDLIALRLPLTRFETEVIELESLDAAREALFCVREDGMSMEEVATEGRYPYRRADFLLEDLPVDAQQRFVSVSAGDILGPLARRNGFELCRVINKIEPQADDPNVQSRIDQRLLARHFSELARRTGRRRLGGVSNPAP